jgi:Uncharacterized protein conserved in bacteria (DUF2188)
MSGIRALKWRVQRAAEILRNAGGGERVTHGVDGRIRSKDTMTVRPTVPRPPR